MLELRIKQGRKHVPLFELPTVLGRAGAVQELGDTIEGLLAFLDDLSGDPDLEETDAEDSFWLSPTARRFAPDAGCPIADPGGAAQYEDDEEDDPSGQSTEDEVSYHTGPTMWGNGPGCPISDPAEHNGRTPGSHSYDSSRAVKLWGY